MRFRKLLKLACFSLIIGGCASKPSTPPFQTRLYVGNYDDVWLAALKSLNDYPLRVSNKDSGRIVTETVNGPYNELVFAFPGQIEQPERFRYSLKLNFAKLTSEQTNQSLVRVRVIKELEQFQDFYTGWLSYPSDGVEERILLYRIEHVLGMEKALNRKMQLKNKEAN
jgi:hypothetical protein